MNRNHKPSSYEDWSPWGYRIGHFQPVAIDQQRLLVSTWEKRCYVLDLKHRTCTAEPLIGPPKNRYAGRCLRSPTVSTIGTVQICAVATTAGWAGVWRLGATEATVLFPVSGGSVNATAMAQDGGRLAVGLGYYPLDSVSTAEAVVELWDLRRDPIYKARRKLPGVAIDHLAWSSEEDVILAVSGARDQNHGYVALLDGSSLNILDIAEVEHGNFLAARLDSDTQRLLLAFWNRIEERPLSDLGTIEESLEIECGVAADISEDLEEVIFASGLRLDVNDASQRFLPELSDCAAVLFLTEDRILGISEGGTVRIWSG